MDDEETLKKCAPQLYLLQSHNNLKRNKQKMAKTNWPLCVHDHVGEIHVQVPSLRTNFSKGGEYVANQGPPIFQNWV